MTDEEIKKEEQIVRGLLTFTIGKRSVTIPELKWRMNREWQALLPATFRKLTDYASDMPDGLAAMGDAERELVLAYDAAYLALPEPRPTPPPHPVLGDLEDATEREIDAIYNGLVTVAFPLAASQTSVQVAIMRAVLSARENSTNGLSTTGSSTAPTILKAHSRSAKSGSSTRRRKSA